MFSSRSLCGRTARLSGVFCCCCCFAFVELLIINIDYFMAPTAEAGLNLCGSQTETVMTLQYGAEVYLIRCVMDKLKVIKGN